MTTVWELTKGNSYYRVASAGNALRLYTNGIFHSQWNRKKPFSGHLWDLLSLPAFLSEQIPQSGLVLGVGGGAVIKTLHSFFNDLHLHAVDLDPVHIDIAINHFCCDKKHTTYFEQNARDFVQSSHTIYDLIIDDLFLGNHAQCCPAQRSIEPSTAWLKSLTKRLSKNGTLVMNFESEQQLRTCVDKFPKRRFGFKTIYSASTPRYENAIGVFCRQQVLRSKLAENLHPHYSARQIDNILAPFEFNRLY